MPRAGGKSVSRAVRDGVVGCWSLNYRPEMSAGCGETTGKGSSAAPSTMVATPGTTESVFAKGESASGEPG